MIDKEAANKISQLLNNGFAFDEYLSKEEREFIEQGLLSWYNRNAISAFTEEGMIYVIDSRHKPIMVLEITRNSIYFNPREHELLLDIVVVTLEYITETLSKPEETQTIPEEDDSTEEMPKPKPNFDFL